MKLPQLLCLSIGFLVASSTAGRDRMVEGFPDLPPDAAKVAERSLGCLHFGGEVNGTGDERDRWVAQQMRELCCDRVEKDLAAIKRKYWDQPAILAILSEATYD